MTASEFLKELDELQDKLQDTIKKAHKLFANKIKSDKQLKWSEDKEYALWNLNADLHNLYKDMY